MKKLLSNNYFYNKKRIYNILIFLNLVIISSIFILNYFTDRFSNHHKVLVNTVINIKYLSTQSHLWFEEFINGDEKEYSKIYENLEKSIETADTLIFGGYISGIKFKHTHNDEYMVQKLKESKEILKELEIIKKQRILTNLNNQQLDEIYDINFHQLTTTLEELELHIQMKFKNMYELYTKIKYIVYISIVLIMSIGFYLVFKFNKEIEEKTLLSYIDPLTNIQNRKGYNKELLKQLEIFKRYNVVFSMIIFDIDNFKQINDTYGHSTGDRVLVDISTLVESLIRNKIDSVFRIGGEEFVVLCPNSALKDGEKVAEKIRSNVEEHLAAIKDKTVTISLGLTEVSQEDDEDSIFKRADELLYQSKTNGKNRVTSG